MIYIPGKKNVIRKNNLITEYSRAFLRNQRKKCIPNKLAIFGSSVGDHGFIVKKDLLVLGWGMNDYNQLGLGDNKNRTSLTIIPFLKKKRVIKICCGCHHSLFLLRSGLFGCGRNKKGQLGMENVGFMIPKQIRIKHEKETIKVLDVFVGSFHSVVLSTSLNCYSFGWNNKGQLGVGDSQTRKKAAKVLISEKVISVSCGGYNSYFITIQGGIYISGSNRFNQISRPFDSFFNSNMAVIPEELLFFKSLKKMVLQISCGIFHVVYLTADNKVYGSGKNNYGELGIGNCSLQKTPCLVSKLENKNIIFVDCGAYHTLFVGKNNIWNCGSNYSGQLGFIDEEVADKTSLINPNVISPVLFSIKGKKIIQSLILRNTSIHFTENEVFGCGNNMRGQIFCGCKGEKGKNNTPFKILDLEVKKHRIHSSQSDMLERIEFLLNSGKEHYIYS